MQEIKDSGDFSQKVLNHCSPTATMKGNKRYYADRWDTAEEFLKDSLGGFGVDALFCLKIHVI